MTGPGRRGRIAVLTAAFVLLGAGSALADATIEANDPNLNDFSAATYALDMGESAFFLNTSGNEHNVTAAGRGPDGKPLFRSRDSSAGTVAVPGTQYLAGGTYRFVCTIHLGMAADLFVDPTKGTPVARPSITVAIPAQTLGSVRRSGRVKVRIRAATRSDNVSVLASKGGIVLGRKANLDLAAGANRLLRLPLTARGRRALSGLERVAVSARAAVPFGRADSARRTLR